MRIESDCGSQYDLAMYIYSFSVQLSAYAYSFLDYRVSN